MRKVFHIRSEHRYEPGMGFDEYVYSPACELVGWVKEKTAELSLRFCGAKLEDRQHLVLTLRGKKKFFVDFSVAFIQEWGRAFSIQ